MRWRQVRETRALMCCFAAVDPREACLQQLRHTEDWSPIDQDTDRRQCFRAWVSRPESCLLPCAKTHHMGLSASAQHTLRLQCQ